MVAMSRAQGVSPTPLTKEYPQACWNWLVTAPAGPSSVAIEYTERAASSTQ
jgi:hypothetical protein